MRLLCATAARALSAPVETTARELLEEYGLDGGSGLLLSLATLSETLTFFSVSCSPPLDRSGLDDHRVLSRAKDTTLEVTLAEIVEGETASVEFKASLCFDWRKYLDDPTAELSGLRLDELMHSALKTVAAFANTEGGTLYVGVNDDGSVCGLEKDYLLANPKRRDYDGWEQVLRGQVEKRFKDGSSVNSYVRTYQLEHEGLKFVKVTVARRSELTFLRKPNENFHLYIRSGTRSVSVPYEEIEKHYQVIRRY